MKKITITLFFLCLGAIGFAQSNTTGTAPTLGTMQVAPDSVKKVTGKTPELKAVDVNMDGVADKEEKGTSNTTNTAPVLQNTTTPKED